MIERLKSSKGDLYRLSNESGMELTLSSYGAGVRSFRAYGKEIVSAPKDDDVYLDADNLFGKCVGPFLGRIDKGEVKEYRLDIDCNGYSLHSGSLSFAFRDFEAVCSDDGLGLSFFLTVPEVEGKMPSIRLEVDYRLLENGYHASVKAIPSKPYPLNIAFHPYFNLGAEKEGIEGHVLQIRAQSTIDYDERQVPIGMKPIYPSIDFSTPKPIGRDILNKDVALPPFEGYDHCFIDVAWPVILEANGLRVCLEANRRALQVFTLNAPSRDMMLLGGVQYGSHKAIALEAVNDPTTIMDTTYDETNPYYSEEMITVERI